MRTKPTDPVIDEIRDVRHRISERFHHDPAMLVEYYLKLQESYGERLIDTPKQAETDVRPAP